MEDESLLKFLELTGFKNKPHWDKEKLAAIRDNRPPDCIFNGQRLLLESDIKTLWSSWFVGLFFDSKIKKKVDHVLIFESTWKYIEQSSFRIWPKPEKRRLAAEITKEIKAQLQSRGLAKRETLSIDEKKQLLDDSGCPARCWLTGYQFSDWAVDKFLGRTNTTPPKSPRFVDYLKPMGLNNRDYTIEIDHVYPFSGGGDSRGNLRLTSGWANKVKGSTISIYSPREPQKKIRHPNFGKIILPSYAWVVRTIGIVRKCHHEDCSNSIDNCELTIYPDSIHGNINPLNMKVTCSEHDPLPKADRLIPANRF